MIISAGYQHQNQSTCEDQQDIIVSAGQRSEHGAAEMVGVLMLIAIFVVAAGVLAMIFFSQTPAEKAPAVKLQITNESGLIKLYHEGGDLLPMNDTQVYVYVDGVRTPATFNGAGPDNTWSVGEILDYNAPGMPSKVDVVYTGGKYRGTTGFLVASLLLGDQSTINPDVTLFTITATAEAGGTISPSGAVQVSAGSSQTFSISPVSGYDVDTVFIDGSSIGPTTSYTFPGVTETHTIRATFKEGAGGMFRINVTAGEGGTISPGNVTVPFGANQTFIFTPNPGYQAGAVLVNGTPVLPVPGNFTFTNVTTNHTLAVMFVSNYSPGIVGNYYLGQTWSIPAATKIHNRIWLADTSANTTAPYQQTDVMNWPVDYIGRSDDFSVSFDGLLKIDGSDTYTFYLRSDDGVSLTIDGTTLITRLNDHSYTDDTATMTLTPGYHNITVRFYENGGEAVVHLEYSNSTMARKVIDQYYHTPITAPTVDFTGMPVAGMEPLTVQFTDASVDATNWAWDFGDGSPVSYLRNPTHTYTSIGRYNVTLAAANANGANMKTRLNYITVANSYELGWVGTYYANETWTDPGVSRTDYRIQFADSSSGEVSDMANWPVPVIGTAESFSVNWEGYLRVNTSDTYMFTLRSDDGSWLWIDENQVINNGGLHSATNVSGSVALTPGYHHIVVRMYEHTGQAVARLLYSSPNMTTQYVTDVWHVAVYYPPVAGFTATPGSGTAPLNVTFADTSTNSPTSWSWNFGDSATSTARNPSHIYTTAGNYTVILTAQNAAGSSTASRYVNVSIPLPVASFTMNVNNGSAPLTVQFTDTSTNTPTSWTWAFGDGTSSTLRNPSYTYVDDGIYTVTLTVQNSAGSNSTSQNLTVTTPVSGRVYLNADKPATMVGGSSLTLRVSNSWSDISTTTGTVDLNSGDTVQLTLTHDDSTGGAGITTSNINSFAFDDVRVIVNGVDRGVRDITDADIGYNQFSSTMTVDVPYAEAWTQLRVDGVYQINGDDGSRIQIFNLKPLTGYAINLDLNAGDCYYEGGASGYLITPYNYPAPTVTSINPTSDTRFNDVWPWVYGTGFRDGATVSIIKNGTTTTLTATNTWVSSATVLDCGPIDLSTAPAGYYDVRVTNSDGKYGILPNGFYVRNPTADAWSINPNDGNRGWETGTLTVNGQYFVDGANVTLVNTALGPNIPADNVVVVSSTRITCTFNLLGQPPGTWRVLVTNPDSVAESPFNGFTINSPAPTVSSIFPVAGTRGTSVIITNLHGDDFQPGANVSFTSGSTTIYLAGVSAVSPTQITGTLVIPPTVPTGDYSVTVRNTDGRTDSHSKLFRVN